MKELRCNKCGKYYHTDKENMYCPLCIDPGSVPGFTYYKETIINYLRQELQASGIDTSVFERDDMLMMLKQQHPRAYEVFSGNSTYHTITLLPGATFPGGARDFTIGSMEKRNKGRLITYREVICSSCNKGIMYPSHRVFRWFLGFDPKWCKSCDFKQYSVHKRNIKGLRQGGVQNPNSLRSQARALNVSRSVMRNNPPTTRVPSLPVGTREGTLEIVEVFWCEKVEAPRYRLLCRVCNRYYVIPQNHWGKCYHSCVERS